MKNQIAFIDEFGDSGFDFSKENVSTHFIVTAVIIDKNNQLLLEEQLETIRKVEFQESEMKSSLIGSKDHRRIRVLEKLSALDFHFFALVADKTVYEGEGLKFKDSFYKFLNGLVDRELFKAFPNLQIVADEHDNKDWQSSFIKYIRANHIPDLFSQSDFRFSDSKSDLLIQLADIVSGTLGRCYDLKKSSPKAHIFLNILNPKIIDIRFWPKNYFPYAYEPGVDFVEFDQTIANLSVTLSKQFLTKNSGKTDPVIKSQCDCLRYLLFYFQNINPNDYIFTDELQDFINSRRTSMLSKHSFRTTIIAKLRDAGVLISSCPKGYKIPATVGDVYEFVNHSNSTIQPMITRLMRCREEIQLASKNQIDILDHEEYKYLRQLIND